MSLNLFRTILNILMLGYGSYEDIRTREINDIVWVIFGSIGLMINIYDHFAENMTVHEIIIPIVFMSVVGFLMNHFALFGGADILALITLIIIQPRTPNIFINLQIGKPIFFALTVLSNTAIIGILSVFIIVFCNLKLVFKGEELFERTPNLGILKKFILFLSGTSISPEDVKGPPFQYPLESPELAYKINLKPNFKDDEEAIRIINQLKELGLKRVWVSTTLPYIVVIFLGYLISISLGDLLIWFLLLF